MSAGGNHLVESTSCRFNVDLHGGGQLLSRGARAALQEAPLGVAEVSSFNCKCHFADPSLAEKESRAACPAPSREGWPLDASRHVMQQWGELRLPMAGSLARQSREAVNFATGHCRRRPSSPTVTSRNRRQWHQASPSGAEVGSPAHPANEDAAAPFCSSKTQATEAQGSQSSPFRRMSCPGPLRAAQEDALLHPPGRGLCHVWAAGPW